MEEDCLEKKGKAGFHDVEVIAVELQLRCGLQARRFFVPFLLGNSVVASDYDCL